MQNVSVFTNDIFEQLTGMITQTGDFTLTWEELINGLTDGEEDELLIELKRYVNNIDFSLNKFRVLTNPNLFSLEDMVFVNSKLESYYICYNDKEIIYITRDLYRTTTKLSSSAESVIDPNNPSVIITPTRISKYTASLKNSL